MDYNMTGVETIEKTMDVDDVIYLDKKITDLKLKLNEIELFGGEPTINPQFSDIVDYLETRRGKFFNTMKCFTNGLNLTKEVVESLKYMDRIDIYPITEFEIPKDVDVKPLFKACYQKDGCRVMVMDGIYRCGMIHHEKREIYVFDRELLIDKFILNPNQPLEFCIKCDEAKVSYINNMSEVTYLKWIRNKKKWKSNKPEVDRKNFERGLKLMREYD